MSRSDVQVQAASRDVRDGTRDQEHPRASGEELLWSQCGGDVVRTLDEVDLQPLHALSRRLIRRGRDLVSRGGSNASRRDDEILRAQSGTSDAEFPRPADGERGALER